MRNLYIILCVCLFITNVFAQKNEINVAYVSTQRSASVSEHNRQKELKESSVKASALETNNRNQWDKYQEKYEELRDRLVALEFTLTTIPSAWQIYLYSDEIKKDVESIVSVIKREPSLAIMNIQQVLEISKELSLNTTFLVGVVASGSALVQMERADRKLMISYVVDEFKLLAIGTSMLNTTLLRAEANLKWQRDFNNFLLQKDKERFEQFFKKIGVKK